MQAPACQGRAPHDVEQRVSCRSPTPVPTRSTGATGRRRDGVRVRTAAGYAGTASMPPEWEGRTLRIPAHLSRTEGPRPAWDSRQTPGGCWEPDMPRFRSRGGRQRLRAPAAAARRTFGRGVEPRSRSEAGIRDRREDASGTPPLNPSGSRSSLPRRSADRAGAAGSNKRTAAGIVRCKSILGGRGCADVSTGRPARL